MRWRKKLISGKLLFVTAVLLACGGAAPVALAGEFMFMPTAAVVQEEGSTDDPTLEKRQLIGDFFYSGDHGRLRLLSEFQIDRESADMERLQAGWRFTPEVSVWFGRFHNPIGYWNMEHHHGHYMETSAERPRILEFEDEGGPLPIHLMGFLLQGLHPMGTGSVQYELGLATGPRVIDEGLAPVDVIRTPRLNKLAVVGRLAYRPDSTLDDQLGAFVAQTRIPVYGLETKEMKQDLAGTYFSRDFDRLRVFGELFRIRHQLVAGSGTPWPSYWAGYLQAEYKVVPSVWTAFARYEGLSSRLNVNYTAVFPRLPRERQIVGMRWDFRDNQALKLESIRDTLVGGTTFNGFEIQWSGMFH